MPTNWLTVAGVQLGDVLNLLLISKANQNVGDDTSDPNDGTPTDLTEQNRRDNIVQDLVNELRANIQIAGQIPLSLTAATVPPGATRHVLNLAAWQLINSTPNLNMAIITENGISAPFANFYKEAVEYFKQVREGTLRPPVPTDPTGIDYLTAPSATNPAIHIMNSGPVIGIPYLGTFDFGFGCFNEWPFQCPPFPPCL